MAGSQQKTPVKQSDITARVSHQSRRAAFQSSELAATQAPQSVHFNLNARPLSVHLIRIAGNTGSAGCLFSLRFLPWRGQRNPRSRLTALPVLQAAGFSLAMLRSQNGLLCVLTHKEDLHLHLW